MSALGNFGNELFRSVSAVRKDRKSTRLNSSHVEISYAVFCFKKRGGGQGVGREHRACRQATGDGVSDEGGRHGSACGEFFFKGHPTPRDPTPSPPGDLWV